MDNKNILIATLSTVAGGALGATATYFITRIRIRTELQTSFDEQVEEARSYYKDRLAEGKAIGVILEGTAEETYMQALDIVQKYEKYAANATGTAESRDILSQPTVHRSNFETVLVDGVAYEADFPKGPDEAATLAANASDDDRVIPNFAADSMLGAFGNYKPAPGEPHVITRQQFQIPDPGYQKASLTWYEADNTLVDNDSTIPIPDPSTVIGWDSLEMFGRGSGDPGIVYVQNDEVEMRYEVTYSPDFYAVAVLHLDPEDVGKPQKSKPRRMRPNDE